MQDLNQSPVNSTGCISKEEINIQMIDTKLLKKGKPVLICGKEKATVYSNWTKKYPKFCTVQTVVGAEKRICYISDLSLDESRLLK